MGREVLAARTHEYSSFSAVFMMVHAPTRFLKLVTVTPLYMLVTSAVTVRAGAGRAGTDFQAPLPHLPPGPAVGTVTKAKQTWLKLEHGKKLIPSQGTSEENYVALLDDLKMNDVGVVKCTDTDWASRRQPS
ncbi:hypothetical protein NDU88_005350 [Pleurodeles waltl]|uniref:Uncharacterized protein n=1 Tax=Pleurodeles waltl TaxID=8319 RepID=A0AAV7L4C2_PLEWA|nr:hypothetical protein NDU88_005350 [Pleurodeles waltl]